MFVHPLHLNLGPLSDTHRAESLEIREREREREKEEEGERKI